MTEKKECPNCNREMKVRNECISHPTFREECYYCHLMKEHLNLDGNLDNGKSITTPSIPPEGPSELHKEKVDEHIVAAIAGM